MPGLVIAFMAALTGCGSGTESTVNETVRAESILMKDDIGGSIESFDDLEQGAVLGSEITRESIVAVTFLDTLKDMPDTAWDVSWNQDESVMAWTKEKIGTDKFQLYIGAEGGVATKDCAGLFAGYCNMESVEFNHCFDTSQATDMRDMFCDCRSLTKLELSNFDTSQVTDMAGMYTRCASLTELDFSNFDTSQVTDMRSMFSNCQKLTKLDLSSFDTRRVTSMERMFEACENLSELGITSFDTSQVTNMTFMFASCSSLTKLDLSHFDTANADVEGMFSGCGVTEEEAQLNMQ